MRSQGWQDHVLGSFKASFESIRGISALFGGTRDPGTGSDKEAT